MFVLPWEAKGTEEFVISLWEKLSAKDFYFALTWISNENKTLVYIVPKIYFEENGSILDQSMPIVDILPSYMEEIYEGVYESDGNFLVIKQKMIDAGFVFSEKLNLFVNQIAY